MPTARRKKSGGICPHERKSGNEDTPSNEKTNKEKGLPLEFFLGGFDYAITHSKKKRDKE